MQFQPIFYYFHLATANGEMKSPIRLLLKNNYFAIPEYGGLVERIQEKKSGH